MPTKLGIHLDQCREFLNIIKFCADATIKEMKQMRFDVFGICETRWSEIGKLTNDDHVLVYSGGEEHRKGTRILM